ncbi:hypothetical protein CLOM_g8277 [Closterium sp. NIES-68]|nr:hypothetical protein CLOM_g8277 [Closterium sp. NIES-68]
MQAVLACSDRLATSAPLAGSRGALGEDLSATASSRLLADWMALNSLNFPGLPSSGSHMQGSGPLPLPLTPFSGAPGGGILPGSAGVGASAGGGVGIGADASAAVAAAGGTAAAAVAAGAGATGAAGAAGAGSSGALSRRVVSVTASVVDHLGTVTSSSVHAVAHPGSSAAWGEDGEDGAMGDGEVEEEREWGWDEDEEEEWEEDGEGGRGGVADGQWLVSRAQAASALFPPRKRQKSELVPGVAWEAEQLNEGMIDTCVEVSRRESRRAHAMGKEGVAVLLHFDIPSVGIPFPPLRLLVPSSYPHCSPQPWPFQAHPYARSAVVQDAMDRFTRAMRAAKGPLTLTSMAKAWDEHARAAVMQVLAASAPPNACWHAVVGPWHECAADVSHG